MIDYKKLDAIVVKSQEELDMIPLDYKGRIYIEFGDCWNRAVVKNRYYYPVIARDNSSIEAWNNSSIVAWNNSSIEARDKSSIVARDNSSIVARDNSSIEAKGNSQIIDRTDGGYNKPKIKISGNARIVYYPKNINDYLDFYEIKHTKTKATFYKAVRKIGNRYVSDWDSNFEYIIGEIKEEICDTDINEDCGRGIHISHLNWALDFGANWDNLAIIEVETKIKDIVVPLNTSGKVRTGEVKIIREVPLSKCGLYGQIIERRRNHANS